MTLTPMSPLSWQYYVREIAMGREDYYAHSAEREGLFVGQGAEVLGVHGHEADALALERLFGHGTDPRDGSPLGRSFDPENERAVAGFALTFSPPKSVSTLWAVAEQTTSDQVLAAHEAAVAAAFAFVEEHAAFTRRGHNGVLQVDTDGLIGAAFVHRTSRAADPQLHTHPLVANKVRAADDEWLSLDGRELFVHQKAAGMLYKAALRSELSTRLGVEWTAIDENGIAEIEGVPQVLVEQWSARRHELKAHGDELIATRASELGRSLSANERAECFQIAAYRTRTPKIDADTPTAQLREHWRAEAKAWGLGPERWAKGVVGHQSQATAIRAEKIVPAVIARLEERSATWGRADVVEEVSRFVGGPEGESVRERIEVLTDRVLADAEVLNLAGPLPAEPPASLRRHDGMAAIERHGATRFSTKTTLRREAAILEGVVAGHNAHAAVVDVAIVDRVLATSVLGEDQRDAVRGLLTGGEWVALLVGPAGAGKSRALDAARLCWEQGGNRPIGLAPSAMAASVLSDEAGLRSETVAKFLYDRERGRSPIVLDDRSVVVLDEAGMVRTDDLAKVLEAVERANAKLVLVGDPHQLGAVGPGGIFRTLVSDYGAHELETVRRFAHAWEAAASLRLRSRDPDILPVYLRHDRITDGSREQMMDAAFRAWRDARDAGSSLLLMAGDNATADELARRCRAELLARGDVDPDGVRIANGTASYGDEIVTLRNDRRLSTTSGEFVRNGARWRVIGGKKNGSLFVRSLDSDGTIMLPPQYVTEHVALGYALTIHKAEGKTSDRAAVLVDEHMTAAQLYVAMSRGREENRALVIASDDTPDDHARKPTRSALDVLGAVMRHDEVDASAHDVMRHNLARNDDLSYLADLYEEAHLRITKSIGPDRSKEIANLEERANVEVATTRLCNAERAVHFANVRVGEAKVRVAEAERETFRSRLPGRLGAGDRSGSHFVRIVAERSLVDARSAEQQALRACESARHHLAEAERARTELVIIRGAQTRRETWLHDHADEVRWARDLRKLVDDRTAREMPTAPTSREPEPDISVEQQIVQRRQRQRAQQRLDTASEAVLRRTAPHFPKHRPPPPQREGPSLGR
jgi:conjugative relaxase-like TrwC/TraI family protein